MSRGRGPVAPSSSWLIAVSVLALLAVVIGRAATPSDAWDQTQPKTLSYTSDMVANGRWLLPVERGVLPATKPPLYNWLAAPAVAVAGFASEPAHRLPSVLALALTWLLTTRIGFRMDPSGAVGWLASIVLVANYTMFKLGYLARPDMLLTLWLALGWMSATIAIGTPDDETARAGRWRWALGFWLCVALAGLTKGPPALVLLIYGLFAGRVLAGRWRAAGRLGWTWGVPIGVGGALSWLVGVGLVDPDHLREQLWEKELYGRVTGTGPEGTRDGPMALITSAPNMLLYFVVRFLPWSPLVVLGMLEHRRARGHIRAEASRWLDGGVLFMAVVIVFFTLSAGKRADYLAASLIPGALMAAWWAVRVARWGPGAAGALAAVTIAVLIVVQAREPFAPTAGFGDSMVEFAREAGPVVRSEPSRAVVACWTGEGPVQALMGLSLADQNGAAGYDALEARLSDDVGFFVLAGRKGRPPHDFDEWFARRYDGWSIESVVSSRVLPRAHGWPEQLVLYRVDRVEASANAPRPDGRE